MTSLHMRGQKPHCIQCSDCNSANDFVSAQGIVAEYPKGTLLSTVSMSQPGVLSAPLLGGAGVGSGFAGVAVGTGVASGFAGVVSGFVGVVSGFAGVVSGML